MFNKIKDKWNQLDERTKKAVKAGLVATACAGCVYLGADITKAWIKHEQKHRFDNYPHFGIEFDKDKDIGEYYLMIGRAAEDRSDRKAIVGVTLGSAESTREYFNECLDYITETESKA